MTTYQIGNTISWGLRVTDGTGTLADPGTTPTAVVSKPDGTTAGASVTKDAVGLYTATYVGTMAGRFRCDWNATGANSGGFPYTDVADVWPADPRLIISLADARAAMNNASNVHDDEIRFFIASATYIIEDIVGPVIEGSVTEVRSGGGRAGLVLNEYPVDVTAIEEDGVALTTDDYCWDEAGRLWRGTRPGGGYWSNAYPRNVEVTYTVGSPIVTPNIVNAAREEVRFLYTIGQQGSRPMLAAGEPAMGYTPSGFAVPMRVLELCAPSVNNRTPGTA